MTAADIACALGDARREGRAWRCRCPLHGGRSLVLRDGNDGCLLVTCWAGCDRFDVLAELRARGMLDGHTRHRPIGLPHPARCRDHADDGGHRIARAIAIWRESVAAPEIIARYLGGRGIVLDTIPACLHYHPRCPRPDGTRAAAIVAPVEHVERGIIGVHRTYLTHDCRRRDRASLGLMAGGAVRLGMPRAGEWLAIAEGIETALSVIVSCSMPGWAALSAGGIRALVLPREATCIVIAADNDASGTGTRAAHEAAARWLAEGRRVRIAMPPGPGTDFNDIIISEARHVAA